MSLDVREVLHDDFERVVVEEELDETLAESFAGRSAANFKDGGIVRENGVRQLPWQVSSIDVVGMF